MMLADNPTQVIGQNLDPVSNAGFGGNYIMLPDRRDPSVETMDLVDWEHFKLKLKYCKVHRFLKWKTNQVSSLMELSQCFCKI
jgi:hypothetical protein